MKSRMVNCFDYKKLDVPKDLGLWHIPDSEIEEELRALAKDHSGEEETKEEIRDGDCVYCACVESSKEGWAGRSVLLYPGRKLPGAESAEQAVLGKKQGEEFSCLLKDMELCLKIKKVVRIRVMEVGDELAQKLGIPDVRTVEDYYRWYHGQHDRERRERACMGIARFWLDEMSERSEFEIDQAEKQKWCDGRARIMYDGLLAAGYDLKKTQEGEVISEAEALRREAEEQEKYFIPYLMYCYFSENDGFVITEDDFAAEVEKIAVQRGEDVKELMKQADITMFRQQAYQAHTYHLLMAEAEKYLEV
ncbi:MAG: hypothetical protein HFG83_00820 [Dorea sp.]|jgi:FKBP-type peptidyl-prolyl cis-trans isomerase (trigger factor)|nr:hypothetical protein [Dorea sp.]